MRKLLIETALHRPRWVVAVAALVTLAFAAQFSRIRIDTDPENMLPEDEQVRIFHRQLKETFAIRDFLVLGMVREAGMFEPEPLARVAAITAEILELEGVVAEDLIAPSEVDDIGVEPGGILRVSPLMEEPPEEPADAHRLLERIRANPMLRGKLASDDGRAMALFIPLTSKDLSYEIATEITRITERLGGDETYYLAGQPVAQDTFGAAMFRQMAVAAPLSGMVLFLLMLFFFRRPRIVAAPMLLAMMTVIWGMGALIGLGFTVHIMSSMIPIFLMPIAILDSIHILSEMDDRRRTGQNTVEAMRGALEHLFKPALFTSITTMVGFTSLILTPIPPVRVFGGFVAFGVFAAWLMSMTLLPALVVLTSGRDRVPVARGAAADAGMGPHLQRLRRLAIGGRWVVTGSAAVVLLLALYGLTRVEVNDNPVRWFRAGHPLRVADRIMNEHLAGTYLAYLELGSDQEDRIKDPAVMGYIESLQQHLVRHPNVGATTSVADVVKKVGFELQLEDPAALAVPESRETIAQYLFLYEISGGDPDDLFHFITPDASRAVIWVQMHAGDNKAVQSVVDAAAAYVAGHPLPDGTEVGWAGLSYVNIIWQDKMVRGMGRALLWSFVIVFLMMTILFRSFAWGVVSMLPLSGTILFIYGMLGWIGKDYDMPVAVLSALTLGLSIDFAIHLIQQSRQIHSQTQNHEETMMRTFGGTGRAIVRNILVLAIGFVPMFFASLTPYVTVGLFFVLIMLVSGLVTLILLPSITSFRPGIFYPAARRRAGVPGASGAAPLALVAALAAAGLAASGAIAAGVDADADATETMRRAHLNLYYAGDDGVARVQMTLTDRKGRERYREFTMLRLDQEDGGEQRYYTYFHQPSDVRRTTFMVIKHQDRDDDRWIYVPAVDLVRRISANDKNSSFVGSDFSYEDVSGRHWLDDTHTFEREDELDGIAVHVIKSVPVDRSGWAYRLSYIDQERVLTLREEYFDEKDRLIRVYTADTIEVIDDLPTVTTRTVKDVKKNHSTTVVFTEVRYNVGLKPEIFAERYLKNPPREYIR